MYGMYVCMVCMYGICSVPYYCNYYDARKAKVIPIESKFTFIVQATVITIVNYD